MHRVKGNTYWAYYVSGIVADIFCETVVTPASIRKHIQRCYISDPTHTANYVDVGIHNLSLNSMLMFLCRATSPAC